MCYAKTLTPDRGARVDCWGRPGGIGMRRGEVVIGARSCYWGAAGALVSVPCMCWKPRARRPRRPPAAVKMSVQGVKWRQAAAIRA